MPTLLEGGPIEAPEDVGIRLGWVRGHRMSKAALEAAGFPVVRLTLAELADLGQELFRWQMATAVAGSVLGVNPFSAPDVEAAKLAARSRVAVFESTGSLPAETPIASEGGLSLFADSRNADTLPPPGVA